MPRKKEDATRLAATKNYASINEIIRDYQRDELEIYGDLDQTETTAVHIMLSFIEGQASEDAEKSFPSMFEFCKEQTLSAKINPVCAGDSLTSALNHIYPEPTLSDEHEDISSIRKFIRQTQEENKKKIIWLGRIFDFCKEAAERTGRYFLTAEAGISIARAWPENTRSKFCFTLLDYMLQHAAPFGEFELGVPSNRITAITEILIESFVEEARSVFNYCAAQYALRESAKVKGVEKDRGLAAGLAGLFAALNFNMLNHRNVALHKPSSASSAAARLKRMCVVFKKTAALNDWIACYDGKIFEFDTLLRTQGKSISASAHEVFLKELSALKAAPEAG